MDFLRKYTKVPTVSRYPCNILVKPYKRFFLNNVSFFILRSIKRFPSATNLYISVSFKSMYHKCWVITPCCEDCYLCVWIVCTHKLSDKFSYCHVVFLYPAS